MTGSAVLVVGFEAWENLRLSTRRPWVQKYRRPIHFFVSVAFWNLVGAGLFGFMINPPIALYYMQGLNVAIAPRRETFCGGPAFLADVFPAWNRPSKAITQTLAVRFAYADPSRRSVTAVLVRTGRVGSAHTAPTTALARILAIAG
jgi:hypothetical protein